jgi:hypothetical protein
MPERLATEAAEQAVISSYDPHGIELKVQAAARALLVLSEMYYPGWEAEVDGSPATIHKVDGALRGILVPAGNSRIVLRYAPRSFAAGTALSLLTSVDALVFGATALWSGSWSLRKVKYSAPANSCNDLCCSPRLLCVMAQCDCSKAEFHMTYGARCAMATQLPYRWPGYRATKRFPDHLAAKFSLDMDRTLATSLSPRRVSTRGSVTAEYGEHSRCTNTRHAHASILFR